MKFKVQVSKHFLTDSQSTPHEQQTKRYINVSRRIHRKPNQNQKKKIAKCSKIRNNIRTQYNKSRDYYIQPNGNMNHTYKNNKNYHGTVLKDLKNQYEQINYGRKDQRRFLTQTESEQSNDHYEYFFSSQELMEEQGFYQYEMDEANTPVHHQYGIKHRSGIKSINKNSSMANGINLSSNAKVESDQCLMRNLGIQNTIENARKFITSVRSRNNSESRPNQQNNSIHTTCIIVCNNPEGITNPQNQLIQKQG